MNTRDLLDELQKLKIDPMHYCLDGGLPSEKLVLAHEHPQEWSVYYSERGVKTGERIFMSESSACDYFMNELCDTLADWKNGVRLGWKPGVRLL